MKGKSQRLRLDDHAKYRIAIQGRLDERWVTYFDGMTISIDNQDPEFTKTTLTGFIMDQAALHGLLNQIRDLGLPLLLVERIEDDKIGD
jgi:hypothetical protein